MTVDAQSQQAEAQQTEAQEAGLPDQLIEQIINHYGRAAGMFDPNRLEVWEELGLTMSQLRVLFMLIAIPGAPAGLVAETLKVRPSTATGVVDRLVKQHLVVRRRDADDRRKVRVYLTERGREVTLEIEARRERQIMHRLFGTFSVEELQSIGAAFEMVVREGERQGLLSPWPPDPEVM